MSESSIVFYTPTEVPSKWTLYDVLFWVAIKKVPEAIYDTYGIELRETDEALYDDMFNWGQRFLDVLDVEVTKFMGIGKSPEILDYEREMRDGKTLFSVDYYLKDIDFGDEETNFKYKKEKELMLSLIHI